MRPSLQVFLAAAAISLILHSSLALESYLTKVQNNEGKNSQTAANLTEKYSFIPAGIAPFLVELRGLEMGPCKIELVAPHSMPLITCNAASHSRQLIIVAFRHRATHLRIFGHYIMMWLKHARRRSNFALIVIEQTEDGRVFNKGALLNAAVKLATANKTTNFAFSDVIIHDVDHIPASDILNYAPTLSPRAVHFATAYSKKSYRIPYPNYIGGVYQLRMKDYVRINGHTNRVWGWGGEVDDFYIRMNANAIQVEHLRSGLYGGRYECLDHDASEKSTDWASVIKSSLKGGWKEDGLKNIAFKINSTMLVDADIFFETGNISQSVFKEKKFLGNSRSNLFVKIAVELLDNF
ncbi:Beta-1,4-galactosyltransferase 3 [Physocladia obscura]|uniref:Beta-1,4-galactosyltransferase 3 n=1 Tax=Physocladia obscura TaxID=109957 RepID=A0AAD5SYC5_9FUNG|nr:Beta-1,4-galactosyltransferase 3 [Physocladia obscura]